jgi:hypothetical protein
MLVVGDVVSHPKLGDGRWIVIKAQIAGGGYAHGPGDRYPDGYEVTFAKIYEDSKFLERDWRVDVKSFYLFGAFKDEAMLPLSIMPLVSYPVTDMSAFHTPRKGEEERQNVSGSK